MAKMQNTLEASVNDDLSYSESWSESYFHAIPGKRKPKTGYRRVKKAINSQVISIKSSRRHQMETLSASPALCAGNSLVTGDSPHKGRWREALMFSLICTWINGWVKNREAGHLRRYCAQYDVIVMLSIHATTRKVHLALCINIVVSVHMVIKTCQFKLAMTLFISLDGILI